MKQSSIDLEALLSNPNEIIQKIRELPFEEFGKLSNDVLNSVSPDFINKLLDDKNLQAKLIASYVRNNIENFHADYLSDDQMKELNKLIRNAIYTALVDIDDALMNVYLHSIVYVPNYWEDCEYCPSI